MYTYLPTIAGLALIPFIVKPLDALVEDVLEKTLQPVLIKVFPRCDLKQFFKKVTFEYKHTTQSLPHFDDIVTSSNRLRICQRHLDHFRRSRAM